MLLLINLVTFKRVSIDNIIQYEIKNNVVMAWSVESLPSGGPGSIPGSVAHFNLCPGIGCVSCFVSMGGPGVVLTTGTVF